MPINRIIAFSWDLAHRAGCAQARLTPAGSLRRHISRLVDLPAPVSRLSHRDGTTIQLSTLAPAQRNVLFPCPGRSAGESGGHEDPRDIRTGKADEAWKKQNASARGRAASSQPRRLAALRPRPFHKHAGLSGQLRLLRGRQLFASRQAGPTDRTILTRQRRCSISLAGYWGRPVLSGRR